ncbi:hypothetical protein J2Z21_002389 [Streptomyces griseochromogenes]|uniref:Uncharacterized protein n=1 Tax=Streptomyces griseochromogenes TaxID=68214 RepID=A0A1B1AR13_9ACTN|nr:hypothetical protein [Streptomyces griseochromogenes]ANP49028.1 hypothetical protein AVL59_05040 [Streptomyces griseochromogenes]MBP2049458.1 hypothetical protein [Streptomyces griseochromogenes]
MTEPNHPQTGANQWGPGHPPTAPAQPPGFAPQPQGAPGYGYPAQPAGAPGYGYPAPVQQGHGYPQQQAAPAPMAGAVLSIGDITVMGEQIVTPAGQMPLRGAVWNATDMSHTEEKIPTHAIVLAIVFFLFCLLGLFFLLMKEKKTTGYIQITVTSAGRHHSTMIPAQDPNTFPAVMGQINYARSLSGM